LLPGRGPGRGAPGRGPAVPGRDPGLGGPAEPGAAAEPGRGGAGRADAAGAWGAASGCCAGNGIGGAARGPASLRSGRDGAAAGGGALTEGSLTGGAAAGGAAGTTGPGRGGAASACWPADGTAAGAGPRPFAPRLPSALADPAADPALAAWPCGAANASLSLRTTGASIVEDADRTNSPISWSLAITALLSTPNSLASSYTRTFATALPLLGPDLRTSQPERGSACSVRRQPPLFIAACSSGAHCKSQPAFSGTSRSPCPCPGPPSPGGSPPGYDFARYPASLSSRSVSRRRRARRIARRRWARAQHSWLGCRYAPRPGIRADGSGTISSPAATTRSKSDLATRAPHPTHVRITDLGG
jgi:hypothetical protein